MIRLLFLAHRASWIEGERRHGQGVDNPPAPCHARTPVRIKHTSRRRRHLLAPRRRLTSSGGPTRRSTRTGRNIALFIGSRDRSAAIGSWPYSLRVGTDRPRSEHRPFRSGRWPHGEVAPTGHSRHAVGRAGLHETGDVPLPCVDSLCTAEPYKTEGTPLPAPCRPNSDDAAEGVVHALAIAPVLRHLARLGKGWATPDRT